MLLFLEELGSWFWNPQMLLLRDAAGSILSSITQMDQYTIIFVAKGYTQTYDINYFESFSPVAWMNSIKILFSVVNLSWLLF